MAIRPVPVAILTLASVLAGACGGPSAEPATAESLAGRADRVAELAAAGEDCAALDALDGLRTAGRKAAQAGDLPSDAASEVMTATERIAAGLTCAPPSEPQPAPEPPDDEDDDDRDDDDEDDDIPPGHRDDKPGRGVGRGDDGDDD